jgi:hypothetical protein
MGVWARRAPTPAALLASLVVAGVACALLSGFFARLDTLGAHDWDATESARYLAVKSLRDYGQLPFWDPYGCGGFPAWGGPEGTTVLVSPLLPVYFLLPLPLAVRVEVVVLLVALVAGCWFLARGYVEHPLALGFACLVGALSSRMALQAAVGHVWHLYYAGMPWVLGAYDRALAPGAEWRARLKWLGAGAGAFALMIYGGAIYPVPHVALSLAGLAAYRAWAARSARPLLAAGAIVGWGASLASPQLIAILDTMQRFPRVTSPVAEVVPWAMWPRMFLWSVTDVPGFRIEGIEYMWHEYAQYIGPLPLALVLWGALGRLPQDSALRSLRFAGCALFALALGRWGPWGLLHRVPPFRSQHVPTRFMFPAMMLLAVVAARVAEHAAQRWATRLRGRGAQIAAWAAWAAFAGSALLIAREDARCTRPWFSLRAPDVEERTGGFVQYQTVPPQYAYGDGRSESPGGTNDAPGLLVARANVGAVRCAGFAGLALDAPKGPDARPVHMGARGVGDPLYRGEAWLETDAPGANVETVRWSPNEVTLSVRGAASGALLVLNQNWDPGWRANDGPTIDHEDVNATRLTAPDETVTFRYRPRTLPASLVPCALAVLLGPAVWLLRRRRGA